MLEIHVRETRGGYKRWPRFRRDPLWQSRVSQDTPGIIWDLKDIPLHPEKKLKTLCVHEVVTHFI